MDSVLKNLRMRRPITPAMVAGVSSPVDGRIHSPASSYLPTMLGRAPQAAGQLKNCSFICDSMKAFFSSTTTMSSSPRANAAMPCGSSGQVMPTLYTRMPMSRQAASSKPRYSSACSTSR